MKNLNRYLLVAVFTIFSAVAAFARNDAMNLFFEKCAKQKDLETVLVNKELLQMADNVDFGLMGVKNIINKIEFIGIVTADKKAEIPKLAKLVDENFPSTVEKSLYRVLMSVNEDNEQTQILQSEIPWGGMNTFVIITRDPSEMTVVVIYGSLTMSDISTLKL